MVRRNSRPSSVGKSAIAQKRKAILAYAKGLSRNPASETHDGRVITVSLPVLNIITHEELERKYGDIR